MEQERGRDISAPVRNITIDGQKFALVFNNRTARLAEDVYEEHFGRDTGYAAILNDLAKGKYRAVLAVFYGAMASGGCDMPFEEFDEKFKLDSVDGIREIIAAGVSRAMPEVPPCGEADEKDP